MDIKIGKRFRRDLGDLTSLKKSIKEVGLLHPIVIDSDGNLIAGERRLQACKELDIEPPFTIINITNPIQAEFDENRERVDFTYYEVYEIGQYINKTESRQGENQYTEKSFVTNCNEAKPIEKVSDITGLGTATISKINTIWESGNEELKQKVDNKKISVDKAYREVRKEKKKKEKEKVKSKVATIIETSNPEIKTIKNGWHKIGNQYLYCGKNTDVEFKSKLPICSFGFADPPYNAGVDDWDSGFIWEQDEFINYCNVLAVTPGGWNAFNFYNTTKMSYVWEMICHINNGMTHGKCGFANFIKASIFSNGKVSIPQDHWTISINVAQSNETKHKGRKPYDFMSHLITLFSKEGDSIFDLFAGSGTTLLVAEKLGRISYNAEKKKEYCIDIINRGITNNMKYEPI